MPTEVFTEEWCHACRRALNERSICAGGDTDPVSAVMLGDLKLERGNVMTMLKHAPAAREMLNAAVEAGGVFPR